MDTDSTSLNPSSLLDLKAELHKKYDAFQRAKLSQKSDSSRSKTFKYKGQPIVSKEKNTVPKVIPKSKDESNEEDLALKRSQLALEAKAKLYEKITSNKILIDDEESEKYLVDFQRKVLYDPVPTKAEDKERKNPDCEENSPLSPEALKEIYSRKPVISDSKTEKVTEENNADQPIHYQNIQFNEVRDHGTGYFAFSMDESERRKQMEELNKLRQETEDQRLAAQRMQRKRKAMLEARLAKVCERRNIDKSVIQIYTKTLEGTEDPNEGKIADLSSIPLPETPKAEEKKEVKVRPWDIGKDNFPAFVPEKRKTKSQNDYIEDRRSERPREFAPPSLY